MPGHTFRNRRNLIHNPVDDLAEAKAHSNED